MRVWMVVAAMAASLPSAGGAQNAKTVEDDGTVHVPAFDAHFSSFASPEMRKSYVDLMHRVGVEVGAKMERDKLDLDQAMNEVFYKPLIQSLEARYAVKVEPTPIAGLYAETFTPRGGVPKANQHRVLINLHGGGFRTGARTGGRVESIPIAAVGQFKVISVDYRESPDYTFPAASEDVAAVYRALLKEYRPANIGIYGCSAGGYLAGQAMAWLQKEGLPRPGAVGIFGSGAGFGAGYSENTAAATNGVVLPIAARVITIAPYMQHVDPKDPLANPFVSTDVLRKFPPTLLINGVQDANWSESIHSHNQLTRLGVDAQLHLWEGGGHCFLYDSNVPESRDAYDVIAKFFDTRLGR